MDDTYQTPPVSSYDYAAPSANPKYKLGSHGGIYTPGPVFQYEKKPVPAVPKEKYKQFDNVHVAIVSWKCEVPIEDDIPELEGEMEALRYLFETKYGFIAERIQVPTGDQNPTAYLAHHVGIACESLNRANGHRKLFILAYGGHGSETGNLAATRHGPTLRWPTVQKMVLGSDFEFAKLFLIDCCYAGLAIKHIKSSKPAVDWICAADATHISKSQWSFTKEVIEALESLDGRPFTAKSLFALIRNTRMYKAARAAKGPETYVHESSGGFGKGCVIRPLKPEDGGRDGYDEEHSMPQEDL